MTCRLFLACALFVSASAAAQTADSPSAAALDLSVPAAPMQYRSDPTYAQDPPGAYYGDTSGRSASASRAVRDQQRLAAQAEQCQGELHGAVTAGFGHASRGGSSNWQGVNLNSCKTTYGDDGKPRTIGISINVGRSEGPGYFGSGYGLGPYGPGPGWYGGAPAW